VSSARWDHLLQAAFRLEEDPRLREAIQALDSVLEVFDGELDPVDDHEGFAVRRLALSLRRVLTPTQ